MCKNQNQKKTITTNDTFLKAAEYQYNYGGGWADFSCHSVEVFSVLFSDERYFYNYLFSIDMDSPKDMTFNDKLAKLQKKSVNKISTKTLQEVRVLALLFAHHIYNDPEAF